MPRVVPFQELKSSSYDFGVFMSFYYVKEVLEPGSMRIHLLDIEASNHVPLEAQIRGPENEHNMFSLTCQICIKV